MRFLLAPLVAASCALSACYSTMLVQEPEPLAPGHVRGGATIALSTEGLGPEASVRVGLPRNLEARAKVSVSGWEAGLNARIIDSEFVDVMLMPAYQHAARVWEEGDTIFNEEPVVRHSIRAFALPAIAKLEVYGPMDVFLGPDLRAGRRDGERWLGVGAHFGVAIDVYRYVTIVPECALTYVAVGPEAHPPDPDQGDYYGNSALASGTRSVQCGLGFTAGGRHADDP